MTRMTGAALLCSAACIALLSGCAAIETRPGHPLSYQGSSYLDAGQIAAIENKRAWDENAADDMQPSQVGRRPVIAVAAAQLPATRIWEARGEAWNKHLAYEAAAHKAQDVADGVTVPLFGAAIGAAATGLFHAGANAIAGAGLAGTSLGAAISYAHPEQDASTDLTADTGLLCVVTESAVLRDTSDLPLLDDKAALTKALHHLAARAFALENLPNPSAAAQTAQKTVKDAQSSGQSALTALDKAITSYEKLSAAIQEATNRIDMAAQTNARSVDYQSLLSTLQTVASNNAGNQDAQKQATVAQTEAAKLATTNSTPPAGASTPENNAILSVTKPEAALMAAVPPAASDPAQAVLDRRDIGSLLKVTALTQRASDDIASPSFDDIAGQLVSCGLSGSPSGKTTATAPAS